MQMPPAGAGGSHGALPLPSKDNVLPGVQSPHGGPALKLDPNAAGDLKLKLNMDN